MTTVIKILKSYLAENGYGGLVADGAECGCELEDLVPCGSDCSSCEPGYKHADPRPENPNGWAIWRQKEVPTDEQWSSVDY